MERGGEVPLRPAAREFAIAVLPALPQGHLSWGCLTAVHQPAAPGRGFGDLQPRTVVGREMIKGPGLV